MKQKRTYVIAAVAVIAAIAMIGAAYAAINAIYTNEADVDTVDYKIVGFYD